MKKIIILIILVAGLFFWFVPVVKTVVYTNCGSGYIPGESNWDCNFYSKVTLKDFLLSKIKNN